MTRFAYSVHISQKSSLFSLALELPLNALVPAVSDPAHQLLARAEAVVLFEEYVELVDFSEEVIDERREEMNEAGVEEALVCEVYVVVDGDEGL